MEPSDKIAVETHCLRKTFDCVDALAGLDLRMPRYSIFGFLGPNGADKSITSNYYLGCCAPVTVRQECLPGYSQGEFGYPPSGWLFVL